MSRDQQKSKCFWSVAAMMLFDTPARPNPSGIVFHLLLGLSYLSEADSVSFKFVNKCRDNIWPGLLSGAQAPQLRTTGFVLKSGKSVTVLVPESWSGRLWARSHCSEDSAGKFYCLTGDCASGKEECSGNGANPPATLVEFTLNGAGGLDFYDVSLVDGYNLPVLVIPKKVEAGRCAASGCLIDLNRACPKELQLNAVRYGNAAVACRSACEAFQQPQFCCSGAYSTPDTCGPSAYSMVFKNACPRAYSYAYDDKTSTYTCGPNSDYHIVFCPSPYTSQKFLEERNDRAELPLVNKTMMYVSSPSPRRLPPTGLVSLQLVTAAAISIASSLMA